MAVTTTMTTERAQRDFVVSVSTSEKISTIERRATRNAGAHVPDNPRSAPAPGADLTFDSCPPAPAVGANRRLRPRRPHPAPSKCTAPHSPPRSNNRKRPIGRDAPVPPRSPGRPSRDVGPKKTLLVVCVAPHNSSWTDVRPLFVFFVSEGPGRRFLVGTKGGSTRSVAFRMDLVLLRCMFINVSCEQTANGLQSRDRETIEMFFPIDDPSFGNLRRWSTEADTQNASSSAPL